MTYLQQAGAVEVSQVRPSAGHGFITASHRVQPIVGADKSVVFPAARSAPASGTGAGTGKTGLPHTLTNKTSDSNGDLAWLIAVTNRGGRFESSQIAKGES